MNAPKPPTRLDDARRLARQALTEAEAANADPMLHSYHLGSLEATLKYLLAALDAEDGAE